MFCTAIKVGTWRKLEVLERASWRFISSPIALSASGKLTCSVFEHAEVFLRYLANLASFFFSLAAGDARCGAADGGVLFLL